LPTILLVEEGGNFVGCSNFIWPLFLGVPLGIATYSFIASMVICQIRRRKNCLKTSHSIDRSSAGGCTTDAPFFV
jgi:hypothetical protein